MNRLLQLSKQAKGLRLRLCLTAAVIICALLATAAPALALTYTTSYPIGHGTDYYRVDMAEDTIQQYNYLVYTPSNDVSPIIEYGNKLYGKSTMSTMVSFVENQGNDVIFAINGDFYDTTTGIPINIIVRDGEYISSAIGYAAIGFDSNGSAVIGTPRTSITVSGDQGLTSVNAFNKVRSSSAIVLYDSNFSSNTRVSSSGTSYRLKKLDSSPVTLNCSLQLEVTEIDHSSSSLAIGYDEMILTVADTSTQVIAPYNVGDIVTLNVSCSDSAWNDVQFAVGGKSLVNGGVPNIDASNPSGARARSAAGIKADGSVVFFQVDKSSASTGLTPADLANKMMNLGCIYAINLDGGGSSVMGIQFGGSNTVDVVNTPSDGAVRSVANYILLVNRGYTSVGPASQLFLYPSKLYSLPGGSVKLSVKAADSNYNAVTAPSVVYTASSGIIYGDTLTTNGNSGIITVSANSSSLSATAQINIINSPDKINICKEGSGTPLTSLTLNAGETISLTANPFYKNLALAANDQLFTWGVTGNVGTISNDGTFKASVYAASGSITATYNGVSKSLAITVNSTNTAPAVTYADTSSSWAKNYIDTVTGRGLMKGVTTAGGVNYFYPTRNLTKAEFAVIMVRYLGLDTNNISSQPPYADWAEIPSWAQKAVAAAYDAGVIKGSSINGKAYFYANNNITRVEVFTIIARTLTNQNAPSASFTDSNQIPSYAIVAINQLVYQNIVNGFNDGTIRPNNNISRAEIAKVLCGFN